MSFKKEKIRYVDEVFPNQTVVIFDKAIAAYKKNKRVIMVNSRTDFFEINNCHFTTSLYDLLNGKYLVIED
jgi:hypothetical protein